MSLANDWPIIVFSLLVVAGIMVVQVLRSKKLDHTQRRQALLRVGVLTVVVAGGMVIYVGIRDTPGVSLALAIASAALCFWLGWKGSNGWYLLGSFFVVSAAVAGIGAIGGSRPTVWIDNRSSQQVVVFVTDNGDGAAAWYIVPPKSAGHAGSAGLGSPDVRVNLLGWRHEENHVGRCAPGDFDDTLSDVPRSASVRLLVDETGRPSVSLAIEPSGLAALEQAPLGDLSESDLCEAIGG